MKRLLWGFLIASIAYGQGGFAGPGRYEIASLKSGKVMDLDRTDQTGIIQLSARGTADQHWYLEPTGQGSYYIRNAMNGKVVEASENFNGAPLMCRGYDGSPNQQWQLRPGKDGNLLIVSRYGRAVDVPGGSSSDGLHWRVYDVNGESNQRFIFRRVGAVPPAPGDSYYRQSTSRGANCLGTDDQGEATRNCAGVCFYAETDFRGRAQCTHSPSDVAEVKDWGRFGSLRLFGNAQVVEIFELPGFRGERIRMTRDTRNLDDLGSRVGSFRVN